MWRMQTGSTVCISMFFRVPQPTKQKCVYVAHSRCIFKDGFHVTTNEKHYVLYESAENVFKLRAPGNRCSTLIKT